MTIWDLRDKTLRALYYLTDQAPSADHLFNQVQDAEVSKDDVQQALNWLERQGLATSLATAWGGQVVRARISTLGENFVETETSVQKLAQSAVEGAIMNMQNNYNSGPSINSMGDHNQINQNNHEQLADKIIDALYGANDAKRAEELQAEKQRNGAKAVIQKALSWISTRVLSPEAFAAVAPLAAQAALS